MVRGLVFDLDGVLVHTDELHYRAWKALAGRLGLPFTREQGGPLPGCLSDGELGDFAGGQQSVLYGAGEAADGGGKE